jgi:hypothetical protein
LLFVGVRIAVVAMERVPHFVWGGVDRGVFEVCFHVSWQNRERARRHCFDGGNTERLTPTWMMIIDKEVDGAEEVGRIDTAKRMHLVVGWDRTDELIQRAAVDAQQLHIKRIGGRIDLQELRTVWRPFVFLRSRMPADGDAVVVPEFRVEPVKAGVDNGMGIAT